MGPPAPQLIGEPRDQPRNMGKDGQMLAMLSAPRPCGAVLLGDNRGKARRQFTSAVEDHLPRAHANAWSNNDLHEGHR